MSESSSFVGLRFLLNDREQRILDAYRFAAARNPNAFMQPIELAPDIHCEKTLAGLINFGLLASDLHLPRRYQITESGLRYSGE